MTLIEFLCTKSLGDVLFFWKNKFGLCIIIYVSIKIHKKKVQLLVLNQILIKEIRMLGTKIKLSHQFISFAQSLSKVNALFLMT